MHEKESEEVQNYLNLPLFTSLHLHFIAVFVKMSYNKILYVAMKLLSTITLLQLYYSAITVLLPRFTYYTSALRVLRKCTILIHR